jgi:hypothetical protein
MPVLRTSGPYYQTTGRALLLSSVAIFAITITLPCSPLAGPRRLITVPAWRGLILIERCAANPAVASSPATPLAGSG